MELRIDAPMEKDWTKIFTSTEQHAITMAKGILKEKDIESVEINKRDSSYQSFGEIELYVKNTEVIQAKYILSKHKLWANFLNDQLQDSFLLQYW